MPNENAVAKAPRLYHTKSRKGCQRCRARRVKCDERVPKCSACTRHSVPCAYDKSRQSFNQPATASAICTKLPREANTDSTLINSISTPERPSLTQNQADITFQDDISLSDLPESRARRLLELRLLHNFYSRTSTTLPATHTPEVLALWSTTVPTLAIDHGNLLHEILAFSALHLIRISRGQADPSIIAARQYYHALSLRSQRVAIAHLSAENSDAVCFASALIVVDSFSALSDLGYSAWLAMCRGAGAAFRNAMCMTTPSSPSLDALVFAPPLLDDLESLFSVHNRTPLHYILNQDVPGGDIPWDEMTAEAYRKALSYIGSMKQAIADGEQDMSLCRRLGGFGLMVPQPFVEFVEEGRPRALVVLAHYFAVAALLEGVWWVGGTGRREIKRIAERLDGEWLGMIQGPLELI